MKKGALEANDWDSNGDLMAVETDQEFDLEKASGGNGLTNWHEAPFERMRSLKMIP